MEWYCTPTAGHETRGQSAIYGEDGKTIAIVYDGKAHGALLAAAPKLLEACRMALETGKYRNAEGDNMLRAAIAEAGGGA